LTGLPSLEHDHRRDRHDLEGAGGRRVGVDVELGHGQLVLVLTGDLVEHRGDHLARAAPVRPEVDHDGLAALQDVGAERVVVTSTVFLAMPLSLFSGRA
jgi:hypothetical protein